MTNQINTARPTRKDSANGNALVGIIEILNSEHQYMLSLLDTLEEQAEKLKPAKIPDYHLLLDIVDYLTHYPDEYHHPRENLLFAEILQRDKTFQSKLDRLLREHRTLHHYNNELFKELTRIVDGGRSNRPELALSIKKYIAGHRRHMEYESEKIFPMAEGTIGAHDLVKLNKKTRYIDDPLFGDEVKYQYRRLGRNMQTRIESAGESLIAGEFAVLESGIEKVSGLFDVWGELQNTVSTLTKKSWREQATTIKAHTHVNGEFNIISLPAAMFVNHGRYLQQGFKEIREVLGESKNGNTHKH